MRTEQTINGCDWFSTNFRPNTVQERSLEGAVKVKRHGKKGIKPNDTVSAGSFFLLFRSRAVPKGSFSLLLPLRVFSSWE
jgi:hypothetical protein